MSFFKPKSPLILSMIAFCDCLLLPTIETVFILISMSDICLVSSLIDYISTLIQSDDSLIEKKPR